MGSKHFLGVCAFLILCSSAFGQTWTKYDCDTTPDLATPAWSHEDSGGSTTVSDGIMTLVGDGAKEDWAVQPLGLDNATGWTVEFRMRVIPELADWDGEVEILRVRDNVWGCRIWLGDSAVGPDGWQTKDASPDGNTFTSGPLYDVKGWHTYRVTGQGTALSFYRDGDSTPIMTATMNDPRTDNYIKFGNVSGDSVGMEVDYIWWAADGAFAPTTPVPGEEPLATNLGMDDIIDADGPVGPGDGDVVDWDKWNNTASGTVQYTYEASFWRHTAFAKCLRIFDPNFPFDGGVRQTVPAEAGRMYTLSGWFNLYNQNDGTTGHTAQVGIDPTGGTDPGSVLWSSPVPVGQEAGTQWQEAEVTVYAAGSQITLYVRGTFTPSGGRERSFFADDLALTSVSPSTGVDESHWCLYP